MTPLAAPVASRSRNREALVALQRRLELENAVANKAIALFGKAIADAAEAAFLSKHGKRTPGVILRPVQR